MFEEDPKTTIQIVKNYNLKIIQEFQVYFLKNNSI